MLKNIWKKFYKVIIMIVVGLLFCLVVFYAIGQWIALKDFTRSSKWFLEEVERTYRSREAMLENVNLYGRYMNHNLVYNISYLFDGPDYGSLSQEELDKKNEETQKKAEDFDVDYLYVTDKEGNIYVSVNSDFVGKNLITEGFLTKEELEKVLENNYIAYNLDENGEISISLLHENLVEKTYQGETYLFDSCYVFPDDDTTPEHYYAVTATRDPIIEKAEEIFLDMSMAFETVVPYDAFAAILIDVTDGSVDAASPEVSQWKGKKVEELGISDLSAYMDGEAHRIPVDGKNYYAIVKEYEIKESSKVNRYIAMTLYKQKSNLIKIIWVIFVLFLVSALILVSEAFIRQGEGRGEVRKRLMVLVFLLLLFNSVIIGYIWTMANISDAMQQCRVNASALATSYNNNQESLIEIEEYYKDKKIAVLRSIAGELENGQGEYLDPENAREVNTYYIKTQDGTREPLMDPLNNPTRSFSQNETLAMLKHTQKMNMLIIMNQNGQTIAASGNEWYYELKGHEDDEEAEQLQMVLDKKIRGICMLEAADQGESVDQIVAVPINLYASSEDGVTVYHDREEYENDKEGKIHRLDSLLLEDSNSNSGIVVTSELVGRVLTTNLGDYLDAVIGVARYDGKEEKGVLLYGPDNFNQDDLNALKFTSQDYVDDNYKFTKYDGRNVFAGIVQMHSDNASLITLLPEEDVLYGFWTVIFGSMITFLLYIGSIALFFIRREAEEPLITQEERRAELIRKERQELRDDFKDKPKKQNYRRMLGISKYIDRNVSDRSALLARTMISIFLTYVLIRMLVSIDNNTAGLSMIYTVSRRWTKGFHIFSVSLALYLLLFYYVLTSIIARINSIIIPSLGSRAQTMSRLLISFLQYGGLAVVVGYSMYMFGAQIGTVFTTAGILTGILGLAANSMIGDVYAGIFIILEREFVVGDVITINDFTGVVQEIGLKTTKLMDNFGNILTINNSKITQVLNLTEHYSQCFVTFEISQEVPVIVIEKMVDEELKQAMSGNEMIIEGPWFSGIMNMKGGHYTVSIAARCLQEDVWKVQKEMYAKMLDLLHQHGIESI